MQKEIWNLHEAMNKLSISMIVMLLILIVPTMAVKDSLGIFRVGDTINLLQLCSDCTYVNITSVMYPNSTTLLSNVPMQKIGSEFNYTLNSNQINDLGTYTINGIGNLGGGDTIFVY